MHQVEDSINQSSNNQSSLEDKVVEWEHSDANADKIMYEQNIDNLWHMKYLNLWIMGLEEGTSSWRLSPLKIRNKVKMFNFPTFNNLGVYIHLEKEVEIKGCKWKKNCQNILICDDVFLYIRGGKDSSRKSKNLWTLLA